MTDIEQDIVRAIERDLIKDNLTDEARDRVQTVLTEWLAGTRKKPSTNIDTRIEGFRKRIEVFAREFRLVMEGGRIVVRASGEAESTLRMLERGTDWFDPMGDVTTLVIGVVFE